jgi:hypothetical protein
MLQVDMNTHTYTCCHIKPTTPSTNQVHLLFSSVSWKLRLSLTPKVDMSMSLKRANATAAVAWPSIFLKQPTCVYIYICPYLCSIADIPFTS